MGLTDKNPSARGDKFVSGPWLGFFTYASGPTKRRMELALRFGSGRIVGEGNDGIGAFVIRGSYSVRTGECQWNKGYLGKHSVHYDGMLVGKVIQGHWQIDNKWTGGFRIWPQGCGEEDNSIETEKLETPMPEISVAIYVREDK